PAGCRFVAGPWTGRPAIPRHPPRTGPQGWDSEPLLLPFQTFRNQFSSDRSAAATTASGVKPNSRNNVLSSADSPKCSIETISPVSPTYLYQLWATPAS